MADLINVANVADGAVPEYRFGPPYDVGTVEAGGNTFLIVTGTSDTGLSVFQVEANGALTNRYNLNVTELTFAWEVASAVVGGIPYVFVTSSYGLNVFSVNSNGTLNNEGVTSDFIDGGPTAFAGTWAVATGTAGGKSYVFVSGTNEYGGGGGGVTAFEVEANGDLVHADSVFDNGNAAFNLNYPIGLATGIAGGTTYLFVAGFLDNGVSTFSVDDIDGHLTHVSSVNDNGMLHLGGTRAVTTAVVSGTTYLFVAAQNENAVTVFTVGADGALTFASEVVDNATLALSAPSGLTTAVIEGTTYLFVTARDDNSLSVFSVAANGALTYEDHVVDNGTTLLARTEGVTAATVAGKTYVYAAGYNDYGVSGFELGIPSPPSATNLTQAKTYAEGDASVALDDIEVTDADVGETITATLTLSNPTAGVLTTAAGGNFSAGVWSITDTVANVNIALASVSFTPATDNDVDVTITTHIEDSAFTGPADGLITLNVTPANDAPTASNLTNTKAYTEGDASVALDNIVVSEVDTDPTQSITATLTLSNTAAGVLTTSGGATYDGGTGIWTITGTVAEVNAALAAVAFTPATDNDVDATITTRIRDQDDTGPADGLITLDVTPVNDAPTATNLTNTKAYTEGDASVALDNIVVSEVDTDPAQSITATLTLSNTAAGVLTTSGGAIYDGGTGIWTITGTVAAVNAALAAVAFTPATDNDVDATITTRIRDQDNTGTADGLITLDVTPVNDPPTATNLTNAKTYTEGAASVALDDIVVSEVDTSPAQSITATLTLSNAAAGALTTSGAATYTAGTGVWTVTGTVGQVNAALAAVAFTPATDNDIDVTITTRIRDQDNAGPADGTITLDVTPVNDPPTATNLTNTKTYTEGAASVDLDNIVVSEVDTDPAQSITATLTLSNTAAGVLTTSGGATYDGGTGIWTITGTVAQVNAALAAVAFTPATDNDVDATIATHIEDQNAVGPADGLITLDVTPVNDPPTATNLTNTKTYTEGDASVALDDIVVSEVDTSPAQTITATLTLSIATAGVLTTSGTAIYTAGTGVWTITDTIANVNAALALVAFMPATDNDVDTAIGTQIRDQNGTGPVNGAITLDVTPVNDAPGASNLTQTKAYTEGAASVALDDIVVSEVDTGEAITATLTLANTAAGVLTTTGAATYTAGTGVWTITGTLAQVNAALAAVAFTPATNNDVDTTIATHIQDAAATGPADGVITLDVTPVNDPPAATNLTQTKTYTEGAGSIALDDIVVSEVDTSSPQTITATLTLSNTAAGLLTTSGSATYTAGTGVWTITGTVAQVNAALAAVAFTPVTNNDVDATITTRIRDQDNAGPADGTITLDVTPVNDAPTATNLTQTKAYIEDAASVALDDIVVSEVDTSPAQSITATLTLSNAAAGVLTTSGAATYTAATGVWTITGTVAQVNAALAAVAFTPAANNDVDATITTHIQDQNAAGPVDGVITLDVTPVNDAPVVSGPVTLTPIAKDSGARLITQAQLLGNTSDVDGPSLTAINLAIASGAGSLVNNNNGTWSYTPALNDTGAVSFSYQVSDGVAAPVAHSAGLDILSNGGVSNDFNGDAISDVLWRHAGGSVSEWSMNAGQIAGNLGVATPPLGWHFQEAGDFNSDGRSDVLWRHDNGQVVLWTMNGSQITSNQSVATIGNDWRNEGVGDFNGDGRADVLWHNANGQVALWTMDGAQITNNQLVATVGSNWHFQGVLDANGDGKSDVLLRGNSGQVVLWTMDGAQIADNQSVANLGLDWNIVGTGDFDGDSRDDVLLRNDSGQVVIWQMNGAQIVSNTSVATPGNDWQVHDVGDYNGDDRSDVLWRHDSGQVVNWEMNGATITDNHAVASLGFDWAVLNHRYDML